MLSDALRPRLFHRSALDFHYLFLVCCKRFFGGKVKNVTF